MRKIVNFRYWIVGASIVVFAIFFMAYKQHDAAEKYARHRAEYCSALVAPAEKKKACVEKTASAKDYLPWRYELFIWPESITTWAIIATGFVIAWQSSETRKAAEATLLGVESQRDENRAWIMGILENVPDWNPTGDFLEFMDIRPTFRNYGGTPGKIVSILMKIQYLPYEEQLPDQPIYAGDAGNSIRYFGEIDVMPKNMAIQPIGIKLAGGDFVKVKKCSQRLFVYWVVNYDDVHGRKWHTRSCYEYHVPGGFDSMGEGYFVGGPPEYNRSGKDYYYGQNPN